MIHGTFSVKRVIETSLCRLSIRTRIPDNTTYPVHSMALMPQVAFGKATTFPVGIDSSIFINDGATKPKVPGVVTCQNYLTTMYVGGTPYDDREIQPIGTRFQMRCAEGNPNDRCFEETWR